MLSAKKRWVEELGFRSGGSWVKNGMERFQCELRGE